MKIEISYKLPGESLTVTREKENKDYSLKVAAAKGRFRLSIVPKRPLVMKNAMLTIKCDFSETEHFFVNGYQSWTPAREYSRTEEMHSLDRVPGMIRDRFSFESYGDYWFRSYKKGELHGFTFAYTRDSFDDCDLFGSLNEENAYLVITYQKDRNRIVLESDCEGRKIEEEFVLFDFVRYQGKTQETLKRYFSLYGTCEAPEIRGYTSWYLDYQDISQEKILNTLKSVDQKDFDLFQIDDGYETYVGDWLDIDPEKFPDGLSGIVKKIHDKGLKAGIWLAPFVCEKKSRVYAEHPEWLYRNKEDETVPAGSNWSGFMPLDLRKREVRRYIKDCLEFYRNLGFDFFKLDFLYAAAMIKSSRFTRAEMMHYGMKLLRDTLADRRILGCGVPLSSAFKLVDYCRIGMDISLDFDDKIYMRMMHNERISTKNTLQNTIYRHCMDGTVFRCDPDVYLLRDDRIRLTKEQREAVVMLAHLCGSVYMTSDDPGQYDKEKKELLARAQKLAGAKINRIDKYGTKIVLLFTKDGADDQLIYDTEKGVLI